MSRSNILLFQPRNFVIEEYFLRYNGRVYEYTLLKVTASAFYEVFKTITCMCLTRW